MSADFPIGPETLQPGDIMFGPIGGFVPGVVPVAAGQLLLADRTARLSWRRWWHVRHVGVVVQASRHFEGPTARSPGGEYTTLPDTDARSYADLEALGATVYRTGVITAPRLVQAMPSGAEEIDMRVQQHWTADHVYLRPAYQLDESHTYEDELVATHARTYVGTPYGFLTYAALAAKRFIPDGPAGACEWRAGSRSASWTAAR